MTAVALNTRRRRIPAELKQEILARIDHGGLHICEAELRYTLRWDERKHGSLLDLLDELEGRGLIESAIHFRLTEQGRGELPDGYRPPRRHGTGHPVGGAKMTGPSQGNRAIRACPDARLPVIGERS